VKTTKKSIIALALAMAIVPAYANYWPRNMHDALEYCRSDDVDANYAMSGHHRLTDRQCARRFLKANGVSVQQIPGWQK
jgi:hypothetical protein